MFRHCGAFSIKFRSSDFPCLKIIVHRLSSLADRLGQEGELFLRVVEMAGQRFRIGVEQRDADDGRHLEGRADLAFHPAVFNAPQKTARNPGPLRDFLGGESPLRAGGPDQLAKK